MKLKQDKILTAIVGSYPKFSYIYPGTGRSLLDTVGYSFDNFAKKFSKKDFKEKLDKACQSAIKDQNSAGTDIITDGEERRGQYVFYVLKGLKGISFKKRTKKAYRGGLFHREVPTITEKITYGKDILVKDFLFTKKYSKKYSKIGLPGPSTVVDSLADEYYKGNKKKIAFDYARAIRNEIKNLINAGCKIIQFDDPVLLRNPKEAKEWGLKALEECFKGLENKATYIAHICCGYPNKPLERKGVKYKANSDYYKEILSWLSDSNLDIVSIEGQNSKLDLSVLPSIGKKTIMLGVVDVGINTVESVDSLVKRGKNALKYISKSQLIFAPDCGLLEISRKAAKGKLQNMAKAAKILNSL